MLVVAPVSAELLMLVVGRGSGRSLRNLISVFFREAISAILFTKCLCN